jgi:hypothetical protein
MTKYRIIKETSYPGFRTGKGGGNYKVQRKNFIGFWVTEKELRENELNELFDFAEVEYDIAFQTVEEAENYINKKSNNFIVKEINVL